MAHGNDGGTASPGDPDAGLREWLTGHEPSRLDVSGFSREAVRPFDSDALIRVVSANPKTACAQARRDHALLLIDAPVGMPALRAAALDCGFALFREDRALVVAPR